MSRLLPKITIITATLNDRLGLAETMQSVQQQDYPALEHIIIDGGSTDGSIDLLREYPYPNIRWISEPDNGISDAFNKGISMARGAYINFQGAGDQLYKSNVLTQLFTPQVKPRPWIVSGKILRVTEDGNRPLWSAPNPMPKKFYKSSLLYKMALPHQGLFMHRAFFRKFGLFDLSIKFAMDYELLLRAYHDFPPVLLKDILVATWRAGGVGRQCNDQIYHEYHQIKRRHKVAPLWLLWPIDKWTRFKYFVKSNVVALEVQ
jgi:glycosyltransferase involved in cell wall biosynthesis